MKFSSDLLARWLQSTGRQNWLGQGSDLADIEVPALLVPVVIPTGPIGPQIVPRTQGAGTFPNLEIQRESYVATFGSPTGPNVAAGVNDIVYPRFARGAWDITIHLDAWSDFSKVPNVAPGLINATLLRSSGAPQWTLLTLYAVANVPQRDVFRLPNVSFDDDGWELIFQTGSTGAAQNYVVTHSIFAARLS